MLACWPPMQETAFPASIQHPRREASNRPDTRLQQAGCRLPRDATARSPRLASVPSLFLGNLHQPGANLLPDGLPIRFGLAGKTGPGLDPAIGCCDPPPPKLAECQTAFSHSRRSGPRRRKGCQFRGRREGSQSASHAAVDKRSRFQRRLDRLGTSSQYQPS